MYTIYVHTCRLNGKKYVGITCQKLKRRWQQHCASARSGSKDPFHVALREHGFDAWDSNTIDVVVDKSTANSLEREWIATYRTIDSSYGYNATYGGDGCDASDATRAKMRAAKLGTSLSESTKQKIGKTQRGVAKGPLTLEHRAKLSELARTRKKEPRAKPVLRIAYENTNWYATLTEAYISVIGPDRASKLTNVSASARLIRDCCNGKRVTVYGYVWRWA